MKMKIKNYIFKIVMVTVLILSMTIPTFAKSPVLVQEETVLFEQDFKNVANAADLSDFDVSSGWEYFEGYIGQMNLSGIGNISESIMTKESFDMTDSSSWQYTTKLYLWKNHYNIYMGWDEVNNKGYKLKWDYSSKTLGLYKAGNETALAEGTLTTSGHTTYTITYKEGKLTVDASIYTGGKTYNQPDLISYTVSLDDFNGKFGVDCSDAAEIILYNLKLVKGIGENINHWTYEEDFEGESIESLTEKGWVLGGSASMKNEEEDYHKNIKNGENDFLNINGSHSFMPNNSTLSGSIGIKADTYVGWNGNMHYIALCGVNGNEYRIYPMYSKSYCAIVKYNKSTGKETVLAQTEAHGKYQYKQTSWDIRLIKAEEEVNIAADITLGDANSSGTLYYQLSFTDTSDIIEPAKILVSGGSSDQPWLYNFSLYSIPDAADRVPVSYDKVIIDKKFSADDSYSRIIADGFHRYADKNHNNNNLNLYAKFVDSVGMDYDSVFYYTMANGGKDYTLEIDAYREYNATQVRFCGTGNGASSNASLSSYYELEAGQVGGKNAVYLRKKTADADAVQLDAKENIGWDNAGLVNFSNYKINCDYNDDGSLEIIAEFKGAKGTTQTLTYTDKSPLTGNLVYMNVGNYGSVQRFRITEPAEEVDVEGDIPVFNPRFYNASGKAITKIEAGKVYAKAFAVPLDDMAIIAALYDNGHMQDIKRVSMAQLASQTGVKLFDVADSGKPEIRLFVFDNGKSLNKIIQTLELR